MAIGGAIAAILAGLAAGASEGSMKRKQKEEEYTRAIVKEAGMKRALSGDMEIFENDAFKKALGPQGLQAVQALAQSVAQQNAQASAGEAQARVEGFGFDPLGGMAMGKRGATMAGAGGGPTVTGGPGGAVSVQQPGTGRVIPSTQPQAPEAALAQSVNGPAAGPADEPSIGEPVPLPPMGPAAIPPQGGTAPPAAPPARAQTGLDRLQQSLGPGQTASPKIGGVPTTVRGLEAGEKADAIGRRIVAEGIKAGQTPDEMIQGIFAAGGKVPESFDKLSEAHFTKGVRARMKDIGADIKSMSQQQKIAVTEEALQGGGKVPDAWKSMVGMTKDDEHQLAAEVVTEAMSKGMPFWRAREYSAARGLRLSDSDRVAMGRQAFGEAVTAIQTLEPTLSPEEVNKRAALVVQNNPDYIPPDVRASIREPAPVSPETAARITEEGGQQPRLSDTTGQRTDVAGARRRAEAEKTTIEANRAGAVEQAREDVAKRLPPSVQEKLVGLDNTIAAGQRIYNRYKPEYVGPLKARIDFAKSKVIDKSLPPDEIKFRADLHDLVNDMIFQITGKQLGSLTEGERIQFPLPDANLPPATFEARLSALRERVQQKRATEAGMANSQRYRTPAPPPATTEERPATAEGGAAAPSISPEEQRLRKRLGIK